MRSFWFYVFSDSCVKKILQLNKSGQHDIRVIKPVCVGIPFPIPALRFARNLSTCRFVCVRARCFHWTTFKLGKKERASERVHYATIPSWKKWDFKQVSYKISSRTAGLHRETLRFCTYSWISTPTESWITMVLKRRAHANDLRGIIDQTFPKLRFYLSRPVHGRAVGHFSITESPRKIRGGKFLTRSPLFYGASALFIPWNFIPQALSNSIAGVAGPQGRRTCQSQSTFTGGAQRHTTLVRSPLITPRSLASALVRLW